MKFFAVLLTVAFVASCQAFTEEQVEKMKAFSQACIKETGVDPTLPKKAKDEGVFEDNFKLRNYLFCINKKIGFQNEEGVIQTEVVEKKLGPELGAEKVVELIAKCAITKPCPHETALDFAKCVREFRNK